MVDSSAETPGQAIEEAGGGLDRWGRGADGLTAKQRIFCHELTVDWNGTQAALRAGYKPSNAADQASENLRKPAIMAFVTNLMAGRVDKVDITAGWVLAKLAAEHHALKDDATIAGRRDRIKIIELIGKHVDVRAFRTQLGFAGPDGGPIELKWNLAALTDEELDQFERLLAKISIAGGDPGREGGSDQGAGSGEGPPGP